MKITMIRNKMGIKLNKEQMLNLIKKLQIAIDKKGFVSMVQKLNGTSIKINNRRCSFNINTEKLGHNARINDLTIRHTKAGYKRTNTPTWSQREEFNHTINDVLDKLRYKANIKSGEYTIRDFEDGRVNQWDFPETYHNNYGLQVPSVLEIVPLKNVSEAIDMYGINAPFFCISS